MTDGRVTPRTVALAATLDVIAVFLFVAIGRNNHDESGPVIVGILKVAAPFVIGLALGWLAARAWLAPLSPVPTGVVIWLVTVIGGMLLRRFVFDRGTALPFIIVASLFTLLLLVGWRVLAEWQAAKGAKTA